MNISTSPSAAWIFSDMVSPLGNGVLLIERVCKAMRYRYRDLLIRCYSLVVRLLGSRT